MAAVSLDTTPMRLHLRFGAMHTESGLRHSPICYAAALMASAALTNHYYSGGSPQVAVSDISMRISGQCWQGWRATTSAVDALCLRTHTVGKALAAMSPLLSPSAVVGSGGHSDGSVPHQRREKRPTAASGRCPTPATRSLTLRLPNAGNSLHYSQRSLRLNRAMMATRAYLFRRH